MPKIAKTNAARLLDREKVAYELVPYPVDEDDLSAAHLAAVLGLDVNQIFKTLVLHGDKTGHFVCIVPGGAELDMKKAARISGNKSCSLIAMKDLLPLTGYMRGGCSPVGMKKPFPAYIDTSALHYPLIYVSAGQRGLQFRLNPTELVRVIAATVDALV